MLKLVLTSCKDEAEAMRIARAAVEQRLAACVQINQPMKSVYPWKGTIEESKEVPVTMKTHADCVSQLQALVVELHSYDVPEFVVLDIEQCLPAYAEWLVDCTKGD